ncbi:FAD-dependent monooxygenase [Nonomuraea salmonea]|uniref:FAD-dependent monooxygenase n=1 Tax=Nonomuraea salmonea TaxID=46181 RepID=UPI002FE8BD03
MSAEPQVIVIGAGPVGQSAALLLARWGVQVLVLDQRPGRGSGGSKSICQQRDVLDIWAAAGAGQVAEEGLAWTTARTYYRDRELLSWTFEREGPLPPCVNISQTRTEQILDAAIAAQPLVEVRWEHEVTDLTQDDSGVTVHCGQRRLRAPYVLVCAGARAQAIRAALGVTFTGETYDDQFLICDIKADLPGWENERRFYFDPVWNPGRQVLIHPCPGGTYRIDWQIAPDFIPSDADIARKIRQVIGDRPYELLWHSTYRFHARLASRMRVGRVLLAGDCAHLVAPFGARGLNSGVPDAENAAWKLAFVLNGWAGGGAAGVVPRGAARGGGGEPGGDRRHHALPRAAHGGGAHAAAGRAGGRAGGRGRLGAFRRALLVRRLAPDHARALAPLRRPSTEGRGVPAVTRRDPA